MFLKALVYSPSGHGKTFLLGTALGDPRLTPGLILDFEGGIDSIWDKVTLVPLEKALEPKAGTLMAVRIKTWLDFQKLHDALVVHNPYKFIALDSLSEINYLALEAILHRTVARDPSHDPDILEQRDYLRGAIWMRRLIRAYRDLDCHVVMTALATLSQDPVTQAPLYLPSLVGKLATEVPALFSVVGYLGIVSQGDQVKRRLLTQPRARFFAKDRSGKLGEWIDEPTLPKILDLLQSSPQEKQPSGSPKAAADKRATQSTTPKSQEGGEP